VRSEPVVDGRSEDTRSQVSPYATDMSCRDPSFVTDVSGQALEQRVLL
jgi:hypothetical protein